MPGIILSLLVAVAAFVFAFHSDEAYKRPEKRLQESAPQDTAKNGMRDGEERPSAKAI